MSGTPELALLAAINVLRDSIETGRMPSGLALEPAAMEMHELAIAECERLFVDFAPIVPPAVRIADITARD